MTDAELINAAKGFRDEIIGQTSDGFCHMVCAPLAGFLAYQGVDAAEMETEQVNDCKWFSHCWIQLPDGRALDPTADQFPDMPEIYLGEPLEIHIPKEPTQ